MVRVVEVTEAASAEVAVARILREAGSWPPGGGRLAGVVQGELMAPQGRPGTSL